MKRIFYILSVCFLVLFLSSCLTTLYPIFHEKDAIFNLSLLGYWKCAEGNSKERKFIEFKKIPDDRKPELPPGIRKISDKGYLVSRIDSMGQTTSQSFVFLAKIGKNNYLDYYPAEMSSQKNVIKIYKDHYLKIHSNYRCDFKDNDHFEMKRFDQGFLDKLISNNKINIRHEVIDGNNLITASTNDLQKFIIQYSDNPDAFGGDVSYCSRIGYH
jgi:hypothetical protein